MKAKERGGPIAPAAANATLDKRECDPERGLRDGPCLADLALPPTKSSFFLGLRVLPSARRRAMYAIYGFCRAVDDIADGDEPSMIRLAQLEAWRGVVAEIYAGGPVPTPLVLLRDAIRDFDLRREDFELVIDGMVMDAGSAIVAPTRARFDLYVDRVACAPGRLSVRVFGVPPAVGSDLAHHLGRALQITNILRDLDEDAARGRLYLPRDALEAIGLAVPALEEADPSSEDVRRALVDAVLVHSKLPIVCDRLAREAWVHFGRASAIMDAVPRRAARAPRLMAAAYRSLYHQLLRRGWEAPRGRVAPKRRAVLAALLRHAIF